MCLSEIGQRLCRFVSMYSDKAEVTAIICGVERSLKLRNLQSTNRSIQGEVGEQRDAPLIPVKVALGHQRRENIRERLAHIQSRA